MIKTIIAAAVIGLSVAPTANANELNEFITDLKSSGWNVTTENEPTAVALGLGVCVDLYNGYTLNQEYQNIVGLGFTADQAEGFLNSVVTHLCPSSVRGSVQ